MKAIITNEREFSEYVDAENKKRCIAELEEQYALYDLDEYMINAGEGYSQDRVFVFEPVYTRGDEVTFRFIGPNNKHHDREKHIFNRNHRG
jgi:hypothetical protein